MLRTVVRGLTAAVAAGALATAAGCGGPTPDPPGPSSPQTLSPTPSTEATTTPDPSASVFLGKGVDDSNSHVEVPTAPVGEPASGDVTVVNTGGDPVTVQNLAATVDSGETSIIEDTCTDVELPPGGTCRIRIRHIATEPGSYSGQLTATTSDGGALSVGISGQAVREATPGDEDTSGTGTPSPSVTTGGPTESETPDPSPTDSPEPGLTD
ncbi:hypothetical protein ACFV0H_12675 [Streptomyces erythrochromogenes]|uniref:Choice-of-anchor D domain-containing protein n=1 Tax=Streptomyces erythrochromogenes TaxID=285574 RepID=A0ABZ1QF98_9ACTN|nr:hypothetical protein [Streptomyces erythrochromogenes]MCX5586689.1 hypothetical protein [Streptomyces erythrochromogenes]